MENRQQQQQQWTVHAEFTISHPGATDPNNPPKASATRDENGVKMSYTWSAPNEPSSLIQQRFYDETRPYSFQKGSLVFTSTPPRRFNPGLVVPDSGYGSDLLSPNSSQSNVIRAGSSCGRTQSLRCQTPSSFGNEDAKPFYGCGDPWCHHPHYGDLNPVKEVCEEFKPNCTCPVCDPNFLMRSLKRDVSVQTYEMVNKCTSPMLKIEDEKGKGKCKLKRGKTVDREKVKRPSRRSLSCGSSSQMSLSRSPTHRDIPSLSQGKTSSDGSDSKPRMIHIDVYCTGTDLENDSSSDSSESDRTKTTSTAQTVFESKKMCVTHKNADDTQLPYSLRKKFTDAKQKSNTTSTSLDKDNSDDESTAYPSKLSSYSNVNYSLSTMSSFPISSMTDTTSWKDTFTDAESLLQSRSSVAPNDSSYFIPKRITEETELCTMQLQPNDSFEYANSEDRLRIKRMEKLWKTKNIVDKRKLFRDVNLKLSQIDNSDSEGSDASEKGWTFLETQQHAINPISDSSSNIRESPSTVILKENLIRDPRLGSPFTLSPGRYTEPRFIAKRFGAVITTMKKPGHHIGPVRNPHCSCDHCRQHFEGYRTRTGSMDNVKSPEFNVLKRSTTENRSFDRD